MNVSAKEYNDQIVDAIEPFVFEFASKHRGSISAEHGLGLQKGKHIHYSKTPEMVNLMKDIKNMIDPKGIMNPYKFLV